MQVNRVVLLLIIGFALWVVSLWVAHNVILFYLEYGIFIGPILYSVSILLWVLNYYSTNRYFPNPLKAFNNLKTKLNNEAGMIMSILAFGWYYFVELFITVIFISMALFTIMNYSFVADKRTERAKNLIVQKLKIKDPIANLKHFSNVVTITGRFDGTDEISIGVYGNMKNHRCKVILNRRTNKMTVVDCIL